jgi:hypothetical protein
MTSQTMGLIMWIKHFVKAYLLGDLGCVLDFYEAGFWVLEPSVTWSWIICYNILHPAWSKQ